MNKMLTIGIAALIIGGIAYYPSYRAPIADDMVKAHLNQIDQHLKSENMGQLQILEQTTDRSGSHVEFEVVLHIPEQYQSGSDTQFITLVNSLDIEFGLLPSSKGFKTIHSNTTSPEINGALAELGNVEGLTITCKTTPSGKGYESECGSNAILLENKHKQPANQDVNQIELSPTQFTIVTHNTQDRFEINWEAPSFQVQGEGKTLAAVEGIKLTGSGPVDPKGKITLLDSILMDEFVEGTTNSSFTVDSVNIDHINAENPINFSRIHVSSIGEINDGFMKTSVDFSAPEISGLPIDIKSLNYNVVVDKIKTEQFLALNRMLQNLQTPSADDLDTFDEKEQEQVLDYAADLLAAGPKLDFNFNVTQASDNQLKVTSVSSLKEQNATDLKSQLETLLNLGSQDRNAVVQFLLKNSSILLEATADTAMAEYLAASLTSGGAQGPQMSSTQRQQAAAQGLAMLEMMGIIAREDSGFTAKLEAGMNRILLNGKDISPLLGLPPQSAIPQ